MNKVEYQLMSNYLEQLSYRTESAVRELQLLQKHICVIKDQVKAFDVLSNTNVQIPNLNTNNKAQRDVKPTDLIKIQEVMKMTGVSRSFIYFHKKNGDFPDSINLGSRSVAWVRSSIEEWVLGKINNK